jgi:hypothetical protein
MGANQNSSRELGQDRIAIEKLSAIETGLGTTKTQGKTAIDTSKVTCETTVIKIESQNNPSPLAHFTEHLAGVFRKPP